MAGFIDTITSGVGELTGAFTARRRELMHGGVDKLFEIQRDAKRVFLRNVSRDISVQDAWFTTDDGQRQALPRRRRRGQAALAFLEDMACYDPVAGGAVSNGLT